MAIDQIQNMRKKIDINIVNIYMLVVSILFFSLFLRVVREFFNIDNQVYTIYLLLLFNSLVGIGFIIRKIPLAILTGFIMLIYATWLYYCLYNGIILEHQAIGYYIWFVALPLGTLVSNGIKNNLDQINKNIDDEKRLIEKYSTRDIVTGYRNKREFLNQINIAISAYIKKKMKFSIVLISLQDLKLTKEVLDENGVEELYKYISLNLNEITDVENEKFNLGEGQFGITLWDAGKEEIEERKNEMKKILLEKLEKPTVGSLIQLRRVPFKISALSLSDEDISVNAVYTKLLKGLENDK